MKWGCHLLSKALWTVCAVAYLLLAEGHAPNLYHPRAITGFETLTMIFWFAGFIALAAFVNQMKICRGGVCHAAQAAIVFSSFEWVAWLMTMVMWMQASMRAKVEEATKTEGD
ncbi:MAG: hypothetical protein M1840_000113 [Geoglossum simile]|nr:MAG: hypothetical protein M1840_000113 [Geoglossum simile]